KLLPTERVIHTKCNWDGDMKRRTLFLFFGGALLLATAWAQEQTENQQNQESQLEMAGMDMSGHDMSDMKSMTGMESDGSAHAMHTMESRHMDMGPHMKMTAVREAKPGDAERAEKIVEAARVTAEKYQDYHA